MLQLTVNGQDKVVRKMVVLFSAVQKHKMLNAAIKDKS